MRALALRQKLGLGPKVIAIVLSLALGGALVGAASNVTPTDRFTAEALIAIQHDPGPRQDEAAVRRLRWEAVADVARLPVVVKRAARTARDPGLVQDVRGRVEVGGVPGGSVLRVRARGRAPSSAIALADAITIQTVVFFKDVNRRSFVANRQTRRFSFEGGIEGWGPAEPEFSLPPRRLDQDRTEAKVGKASLSARCGPQPGCGPSVQVEGEYLGGTTQTARAFLRSPDEAVRVRLVLGTAPEDVGTGPTLTLSRDWTETSVRFTPKDPASAVELGVQKLTSGAAEIFVDDASLAKVEDEVAGDIRTGADRREVDVRARAAAEDRYSVMGVSTLIDRSEPRTALWALLGGGAGLVLGLTGVVAAAAARSRRHRSQ